MGDAGELATLTYPSGRVVTQAFDPIGRLNLIASGGTQFLHDVTYNAAHEPTGFTYGNNITASFAYNARLQLQDLAYRNGSTDLFHLAYNYGTGNNGQIQSITDSVDASRNMAYTYDAWNRVKEATAGPTGSPTWKLGWDYDRYGNRKNQNVLAGTGFSVQLTISESTNRITSPYAYDPAGNMTNDTLHSYSFDAENRITQVDGGTTATNTFDGNSFRVKKVAGAATTRYIFSGTKVIAEYDNDAAVTAPTREHIYAGAQLLATIEGSTTTYHHPDHLSTRLSTDSTAAVVRTFGQYPFGETWYETGTSSKWKFTSYERDPESALDYAMFRFDSSRLGRFMTPDPLAGTIWNPQSLNRYAYTLNDPVNLVDPLGLEGYVLHVYVWFCSSCGSGSLGLGPGFGLWDTYASLGWGESNAAYFKDLQPFGEDPYTTPAARAARQVVNAILAGLNDCSAFFNDAASKFSEGSQPSAKAIFEAVDIRLNPTNPTIGGQTEQGSGWMGPIFVNPNGPFSNAFGFVNGQVRQLRVGPFIGGSLEAQVTILLHELAHKTSAVPSDRGKPEQSAANTRTVLDRCRDQIQQGGH